MVNYNNGKIYKIEALNGADEDIYIGSTTKQYLSQRMDEHRSHYKSWLKGTRDKTVSYDIFQKYDIINCRIVLLEIVHATTKDELLAREAYYIKTLPCVNKKIPAQTVKEWCEVNKVRLHEKAKVYREIHKEKLSENSKQYRTENADKIAIGKKVYAEKQRINS